MIVRTAILAMLLTLLPFTSTLDEQFNASANSSARQLSRSVFDFGLRLQRAMLASEGHGNVAVSPTSVVGVLALTLLGSVGKTYDELTESLGYSTDVKHNQNHHRTFGEQLQNLNAANSSSKTLYANAVFVDRSARLREIYKDFLDHVYHATVSNVNFADGPRTTEIINKWVGDHTENKIPEILKEPLSTRTRVVLASAMYFSGQWLNPFFPQYTQKTLFSPDSEDARKDIIVDTMLNVGKFRYTLSLQYDCELVAIPYNDSATTFYALKPRDPKRKSLRQLIEELDADKIDKLISDSKSTNVIVRIPKMKLSSHSDLKIPLETLGISSLFSPKDANLALMVDTNNRNEDLQEELVLKIREEEIVNRRLREMLAALPNPGLYIDSVLHDVAISIDEYGTEAVAATVGLVSRTASMFVVNSPFLFFIRNEPTKLVTFSAAVYDPTK